jgi:hypothetical protein
LEWKRLVYIFYCRLEYLYTAMWHILWPLGNLVAIWYMYFPPFWYIVSRKIWQPRSIYVFEQKHIVLVCCAKKNMATLPESTWNVWISFECLDGGNSGEVEADDADQGCQIFLGTTYQNGKSITGSHKIYQMTTKYTKWQ